jgi:hypothetical protein
LAAKLKNKGWEIDAAAAAAGSNETAAVVAGVDGWLKAAAGTAEEGAEVQGVGDVAAAPPPPSCFAVQAFGTTRGSTGKVRVKRKRHRPTNTTMTHGRRVAE